MRIQDLLYPDCIIDNLEAESKEDALRQMAQKLYEGAYVHESFVRAILDREKHYPSGLPMETHKIAIPHTDAIHVKRPTLLFARLNNAVEFSVMGDPDQIISVRLIFMFALRDEKEIGPLLGSLITIYQDPKLLDSLLKAENRSVIYKILSRAMGRNTTDFQRAKPK